MKVLIADDEKITRETLNKYLIDWGYDVKAVEDGILALEAFFEQEYDIVVLDWNMPGINGLEVCKKIRGSHKYPYIILLTGMSRQEDVVTGLVAGADDYMTKPFHPKEMECRMGIGRRIMEMKNEIIKLASYDHLTALLNRREFYARAGSELARLRKGGNKHFGIIMIDIDHFKRFNDSYGHQAGDLALQETAKIIQESCREFDIIARYGGEEFIAFLPGAKLFETFTVAEQVRVNISKKPIMLLMENKAIYLTVSCGVSSFTVDTDIEYAIKFADDALYDAKRERNNCVAAEVKETAFGY